MTANSGLTSVECGTIPLLGVDVTGEVLGAHARVRVRQRYRNDEARPIEAVYTFPLPSEATLTGFAMTCAGRRMEGVVQERDEAFRAYDDAVAAGHGAALLDQERRNVFTASVGNLLPGEETLIEVEYVQRVLADEGALRWSIPTVVAPRYVPGTPQGDRTAHGRVDPTDRVPDADRITPPVADVAYGLALDLRFHLSEDATVSSPSHAIRVERVDAETLRVRFEQGEVALDRDVVLVAQGVGERPLATFLAHFAESEGEAGWCSLSIVPDLGAGGRLEVPPQDVVFLVDVSGSMAGSSLPQAKDALRLCLRHLREGDRFDVVPFESTFETFFEQPIPFTQKTLEQADARVQGLVARGGTELLPPLLEAVRRAPDGVVVLLTDGQVGNEDDILTSVLAARGKARIYSFGIGTAVSDVLLRDLARRTGGAVEFIHPGERIDEKVVAQFARAIAPRVSDVSLAWKGLEVAELAPAELPALVDGEPWAVFGRLASPGRGTVEVRGRLAGEPFFLELPVEAKRGAAHAVLPRFWAAERIRDLEAADLEGRRAERMKERIVELATRWRIATRFTSFVVIETRHGDRRANAQPETRVVPVNHPAGWDLFEALKDQTGGAFTGAIACSFAPSACAPIAAAGGVLGAAAELLGKMKKKAAPPRSAPAGAAPPADGPALFNIPARPLSRSGGVTPHDPVVAILGRQEASGLWGLVEDDSMVLATARSLLALLDAGVASSHRLHGGQVKKAVDALLPLVEGIRGAHPSLADFALAVAWLVSTGARTRKRIEALAPGASFASETEVRSRADAHARKAIP